MFILATGMVCPIGLNTAAACAAQRAGISAFAELKYRDDTEEPVIGAVVPGIDPEWRGIARLLALLTPAVRQVVESQPDLRWEQVPLLLGLAEPDRPGGTGRLAESMGERLQEALSIKFHATHSRAFSMGHTAGLHALKAARDLLKNAETPACLVCGVDSFVSAAALRWLDRQYRLKTPDNTDGVIPGEAAAAVLLGRKAASTRIIGLGFAQEKAHMMSEEPLLGLGLSEAARQALAETPYGLHEMEFRISDVTGEAYRFKELPLVEARLMRVVRKVEQPLWHWADSIGDIGAAAGVAELVAVDQAFRKGYAPGPRAICLTSAVPGDRAVAVLESFSDASPKRADGGSKHGM